MAYEPLDMKLALRVHAMIAYLKRTNDPRFGEYMDILQAPGQTRNGKYEAIFAHTETLKRWDLDLYHRLQSSYVPRV